VPVHPLLFAAYAVLFLYAENLGEVLLVDVEGPLIRSVVGAAVVLAVAAVVYRDVRRGAILASALVVAFFGYGHVAGLVGGADPNDLVLLGAFGAFVIAAALYAWRGRAAPRLTTGLNVIATILVVLSLVTIVPYELDRAGRAPAGRAQAGLTGTAVAPGDVSNRPDIYYLVFDRYGSADAIERRFGITGNDLYGWLEDSGFQVPADSRAAYRATDFSLASTLNMRYLDNLTEEIGRTSGDRTPAHRMIQDHEVGRFLKAQGYRYYHVGSWFGPTASNPLADENLSPGVTSEFELVLNDTTILPALDRVRGVVPAEATFRDRHREGTRFAFRQIPRLATAPGPKFVFAHILLPHDPYVFRSDETPLSEKESRAGEEAVLYEGQLEVANRHIKAIVDQLLAGSDADDPVVIIQADEGPLLCRNVDCPEVSAEYAAIRFGILNAIYVPGDEPPLPSTFTAVNTFRYVFSEVFGADLEPLPDHSYTWPDNDHIYDFVDVTDLLDER
jgi:hypothetical protein